jgi:hypothetical protein
VTDEKLIRAKDATRYDLLGMSAARFEDLVARLVRLEFERAFKTAATRDGGADMVLPREGDHGYERCWQSKHFPKAINWGECTASLAAARKHWDPEHYTFVFPRELTVGEQQTFDRHFRGPEDDITVDYWNGEELQFRLCGSQKGQRVAHTFFDDVELARERTYQAIEAGGRLDTPEDVLDRGLNLGRSMARDAYFAYPMAIHEVDVQGTGVAPGTVMSVIRSDGTASSRVDIVPLDEEAMERYGPQFEMRPTDDDAGKAAAGRLQEALRSGASVEIEQGLDVTTTRMPPAFEYLVGDRLTPGIVRVGPAERVRRKAAPWLARLRAVSDEGTASLDVLLRQRDDVPEGWDDAFNGEVGGLSATLLFRHRGAGGELRWGFRYSRDRSPVREQLAAMTFLRAAGGTGELVLGIGERADAPRLRFTTTVEPVSDGARALLAFLEDLRVIEEWADVAFSLPDDISAQAARRAAVVAQLVRNRGRSLTWSTFEMTVTHARPLRFGGVVRVEFEIGAEVLGRVVDLGYLQLELTDYVLVSDEPASKPTGYRTVRLEPRDEASAQVFQRLVKEKTKGTRRPPGSPRRTGNRGGKRGRKKRRR